MLKFISSILKLFLAIILIPIVIAVSGSFFHELKTIDPEVENHLLLGGLLYLALHLLLFKPQNLFQKGRRFVEVIFGFSQTFARLMSFVLPVYALGILLLYFVIGIFWDVDLYLNVFLSLVGFSMAFHYICAAEELRGKEEDPLKADYSFSLLIIWVLCIMILAGILNLAQTGFYFQDFFDQAYQVSSDIYESLAHQIYVKFF